MTIHKLIAITLCGLATLTLAHATAAAEGDAKANAGAVGIARSQEEFKGKLDDHVKKELTCSVASGAIGQYLSSSVRGAVGQFVGCAAPTPVCFAAKEKQADGKKAFISAINTRWGTTFKDDLVLPDLPECAIPSDKLAFNLDVSVKQLVTGVKAWIEIKFDMTYINSQKLSFAKNNSFPRIEAGSSLPRANGKVITAYANYDRKFSFKGKVEYDAKVTDVNVSLNLDFDKTNVHYCEATFEIDDQPKAIDCPVK